MLTGLVRFLQVTNLRKEARSARGAEADSSVGMHQLEARLAVAAIEHKQDVRRMQETIEVPAHDVPTLHIAPISLRTQSNLALSWQRIPKCSPAASGMSFRISSVRFQAAAS